ncbi:MAG TPA: DUF4180 domain-containing protein [Solirubrobacteraceae bacterium]|nr:DUF4180 domain-containing protein [Solirubrobacteraceae bacterium]
MTSVFHVPAAGEPLRTGADALGVIYAEAAAGAEWIAVPAARLDPAFFDLRTGVAGEIVQKFVNYQARLAVVGDISGRVAASDALRDFVRESNRGRHVWFVADAEELAARLAG